MPIDSQITTLGNDLRVLTTRIPTAQAASIAFFVGIGSRWEQPRTNGLSHYIEHMLFKGTERRRTSSDISEAIEGAGGQLNAYTTREITCYWNNLPFERVETGIDVLADMLQHSLFEPEEIDRERSVVQQELRRSHDNPSAWVGELTGRAVFGDQPVGWPVGGSLETVEALQRPDFLTHMEAFYTAENSVLSVAGNIEHDQIVELAEREFSALPGGKAREMPPARHGLPEEHVIVEERDIEQTNLTLSMQALGRHDPDRYSFDIMNAVLGRGMSSRLFTEVRERRGLAYSVSSSGSRLRDIGTLTVSAGVTREHQEEALEVIVAELRRLVDEPVPDDEMQRTVDYVCGSLRLSQETARAIGQRYGLQLLMDNELETVEHTVAALRAVTTDDVQRVAGRVIGPREFALAVVGPSAPPDRLASIASA